MASITILNISSNPIEFSIYYLTKISPETLTSKNTAFFGSSKYATIEYPDDCTEILISVSIETAPEVYEHIVSLKLPSPATKFYEFVTNSNKGAALFEITSNDLKNTNTINFKNKTLNAFAIALSFDIGGKNFIQRKGIAKNRGLTILLPFNSKNVLFTAYVLTPSSGWNDLQTIDLQNKQQKKCYEFIRNISNTNFLLNEINCTK